jgi:hypothetical protein
VVAGGEVWLQAGLDLQVGVPEPVHGQRDDRGRQHRQEDLLASSPYDARDVVAELSLFVVLTYAAHDNARAAVRQLRAD